MNSAHDYLLLALAQAHSRRGFCAPNPAVGAVLVKKGEIIAEAAHQGAGTPHAEANVLAIAGAARGATLYVTLEPCNHQGRTPPCTEAIIQQGISAVYYAYADPNRAVQGKGAERLRAAGVQVEHVQLPEIDEFYRSYAHWLKTQKPLVTAKVALSLDGKIAGPNAKPLSISGSEAQHYTHEKRACSDAILTSVRTIINDDPQFNIRLAHKTLTKPLYIVDRNADLPLTAKIFKTTSSITIFHAHPASPQKLKQLQAAGVKCIEIASTATGLNEVAIIESIGKDGVHDVWLEAGGKLFESLYEAHLIQRIILYISPKILGENAYPAFHKPQDFSTNARVHWFQLGEDVVCDISK